VFDYFQLHSRPDLYVYPVIIDPEDEEGPDPEEPEDPDPDGEGGEGGEGGGDGEPEEEKEFVFDFTGPVTPKKSALNALVEKT
jgi:hypothetical protein